MFNLPKGSLGPQATAALHLIGYTKNYLIL
jgi:hypothetical protein